MEPIRRDLPEAVHSALRTWHIGSPPPPPWREMLIVAQHPAAASAAGPDRAVKQLLLTALETLAGQVGEDAAQILRLRFLDVLTAAETARRLNLTEDVVYKRQQAAIAELAAVIWQAELEARRTRETRVLGRLEIKEPARLFGVDDKLAELTRVLAPEASPWLIAVVGIGGIGKTSLADAAVRACVPRPAFADIAWVSARQERFALWNGADSDRQAAPALTLEGLVDAMIDQLGFQDLARLPLAQRQDSLRARLKVQPYLVVLDNLETAADYRALVPDLQAFANPTKVILTARHSLHDYPGVHNLSLDELIAADSLALLRHEAKERGLADIAAASDETLLPIYQVAGGNPLALKLLLGQMHSLSLFHVVEDLRQARGRRVDELYHFIYWRSWHLLSDEARRVLTIMPLIAESGGGLEQVGALSELADDELAVALQQLATLCLVNVQGTVQARRYSIHRLTETFLLNEVLKWQAPQ
jgi:NB-ARC domain